MPVPCCELVEEPAVLPCVRRGTWWDAAEGGLLEEKETIKEVEDPALLELCCAVLDPAWEEEALLCCVLLERLSWRL